MSVAGNYTPLNLNLLSSLIAGVGFTINPKVTEYIGVATTSSTYTTRGSIYNDTLLGVLADVTDLAVTKVLASELQETTYTALINIGTGTIPLLGNTKPTSYDLFSYSGYPARFGWLRLIAYQAYLEFHCKTGTFQEFTHTFNACESYRKQMNKVVDSFNASKQYLDGTFSNMNDLITNDITGVSLATMYFGTDLILSGRAIDLSMIDEFGLPSTLLKTLYKNRALTPSVNLALLSAGLSSADILNILTGNPATIEQEKNIYAALNVIIGQDLVDVRVLLNCQTAGLESLADLLNPAKLFPSSWTTLTFPKYNVNTVATNSKTYYLIYYNGLANVSADQNIGMRLVNILPKALAFACDAFSIAMMQIKNIKSYDIEKFAQVVTNLENVATLATGATTTPTNPTLATMGANNLGFGSGPGKRYNSTDFFGSMSGLPYDWKKLKALILDFPTADLLSTYTAMLEVLTNGTAPYDSAILVLIDQANNIISDLKNNYSVKAAELNTLYDTFGAQLEREQIMRPLALGDITDLVGTVNDLYSFVSSISEYAVDTQENGACQVLESIADVNYVGGQCIIACMREARNQARLGLMGSSLDSGVGTQKPYIPPPTGSKPRDVPLEGYPAVTPAADMPMYTGAAMAPGSLAGSPETALIPPNLNVYRMPVSFSVLSPAQAIAEVVRCNCDCWDNQAIN